MRVYLYGCGKRCQVLLSAIQGAKAEIQVAGVIDSNNCFWGTNMGAYEIMKPEALEKCADEFVCVTFFGDNDYEPIWDELIENYHIKKEKLLSFHDVIKIINQSMVSVPSLKTYRKFRKNIFDGAWIFGLGGVENWIDDTFAELWETRKDVYLLTKVEQVNVSHDKEKNIINFCVADSCEFKRENVEKTMEKLMGEMPCAVICSRVDEVLLSAYMLRKVYPELIRIIAAVHGTCDGIIRDFFAYDDGIERYLCVSKVSMKSLENLGVNRNRMQVMPSLIRIGTNFQREYTYSNQSPLQIGYAGRLEVIHKRADLLMELLMLLERKRVNYRFEIVGEGSYLGRLSELVNSKNLQTKVTLRGRIERDKIFDFWRGKDVAVNVSDSEGRPLSNIEAMVCGAVPIVTCTAGALEDVEDSVNGFIVGVGDMGSMADRILKLDGDRELLKKLGQNARNSIVQKMDIQKYMKQWNEILDGK